MERTRKTFELTPFAHDKFVEVETISALTEDAQLSFLSENREIFEGGKELLVNGYYYGLISFIEGGEAFTILTPYRLLVPKYPKKNFGFGAYDHSINQLFMFFNGVATTDSRSTAIQVYNSLVRYCQTTHPDLEPFTIKM
jgi:hypothetical protein